MRADIGVVLVSNRGPVSFVRRNGQYDTKRGAGGLAGALDPVARALGERALWIAAATSDDDRSAIADGITETIGAELGYRLRMLDIDPKTFSLYYDVVSNRMLWFANHCLWDELDIEGFGPAQMAAWQDAYEPVNKRFAESVAREVDNSWFVLFQDYHLATAPAHLRAAREDQPIFHFTHTSFCGSNGLERLPSKVSLEYVRGMLGADLLGFHIPAWVDSFLRTCAQFGMKVDRTQGFVDHDGRRVWVRPYPIPIDAKELTTFAESAARGWAERFLGETEGPTIVRADRAEPSKNIVRGFEAFGLLLDRRPDLRSKSRFIACLYPSRESMPEYRRYIEAIRAAVDRVNARHPQSIQLFLEDDYARTIGALMMYDVLLVNPIMDGMNLVSKEGTTLNEKSGVLVLSRGAGSFAELGEYSIDIEDPYDVSATADALAQALEMGPDERQRRAEALRARSRARRPEDWIDAQVEDLLEITRGREPRTPAPY